MFNWIKSKFATIGTKGQSTAMISATKNRAVGTVLTENRRTVIRVEGKTAIDVKNEIDRMSDRHGRRN